MFNTKLFLSQPNLNEYTNGKKRVLRKFSKVWKEGPIKYGKEYMDEIFKKINLYVNHLRKVKQVWL